MTTLTLSFAFLETMILTLASAPTAVHRHRSPLLALIRTFLYGTGGGLIRDLLLLHRTPSALAPSRIPHYLLTAVIVAVLLACRNRNRYHGSPRLVEVLDLFLIGRYSTAVLITSIQEGAPPAIAWLAAVSTAIGGGTLARSFDRLSPVELWNARRPFILRAMVLSTVPALLTDLLLTAPKLLPPVEHLTGVLSLILFSIHPQPCSMTDIPADTPFSLPLLTVDKHPAQSPAPEPKVPHPRTETPVRRPRTVLFLP